MDCGVCGQVFRGELSKKWHIPVFDKVRPPINDTLLRCIGVEEEGAPRTRFWDPRPHDPPNADLRPSSLLSYVFFKRASIQRRF